MLPVIQHLISANLKSICRVRVLNHMVLAVPGSYIPHTTYANVGGYLTGEVVFHEQEILCNIAGLSATFPIEDQIKFWMTFIDFTVSSPAGTSQYGSYHGGGSPIMGQIAIISQYDIEKRKI